VTFLHGINRYNEEQRDLSESAIRAEQEARKSMFGATLFYRDLEVLSAIAETAAEIAVSADRREDFDRAARRYEKLYWSYVTVDDDRELGDAMDAMRNAIRMFNQGLTADGDTEPVDQLKRRAYNVSRAVRETVRERFDALADLR
jgi:hypothetical protein